MRQMARAFNNIDGIAEENDEFEVDIQRDVAGGMKLYIHLNGETIVRIGKIKSIKVNDVRNIKEE